MEGLINKSQRRDPINELDAIDRNLAVEMQSEPRMREETVEEVDLEQGSDSVIETINSLDSVQPNGESQ